MTPALIIRPAGVEDASVIADIYNHYVLETTATFDVTPKSPDERTAWIAGRDRGHPVIVAESDGAVVGWGSLNPWGERPGWRHTVEISVYVGTASCGQGIGRRLMEELLDLAGEAGHHVVIGQIVSENEASIRLAEKLGFERVGALRQVGRKFDRWLDVILMEKIL
jgi:L-amino acid N-acyltransferase YncA